MTILKEPVPGPASYTAVLANDGQVLALHRTMQTNTAQDCCGRLNCEMSSRCLAGLDGNVDMCPVLAHVLRL